MSQFDPSNQDQTQRPPRPYRGGLDVAECALPQNVENRWWQLLLRRLDDGLIRVSTNVFGRDPSLNVLMFHGLFLNQAEAFSGAIDPYQPLSLDDLSALIAFFQGEGFRFIAPDEIGAPTEAGDHRVLLTFDDGYANNLRAMPILEQYGVPATIFVASGNVLSGEPFWWDVLYRECAGRGMSREQNVAERQALKAFSNSEIKARLRQRFGGDVFQAVGDVDRPMTVAELKRVAAHELITIGNHTVDHELLTQIPAIEARHQIRKCQEMIEAWTGSAPHIIAYPNGNCNDRVVGEAMDAGLTAGVIAFPGKCRLPVGERQRMHLPRHAIIGGPHMLRHCRVAAAPWSLSGIKHAIRSRQRQAALP